MELQSEAGGQVATVIVEPAGDGFSVTVNGETHLVQVRRRAPGELDIVWAGGRRARAFVVAEGDRRWVAIDPSPEGGPFVLALPSAGGRSRRRISGGPESLAAQMPGVVRRVLAAPGEAVARGQVLVLLEAMKMEIRVTAPHAGRVERVAVTEGASVQRGQVLVELSPADGTVHGAAERELT